MLEDWIYKYLPRTSCALTFLVNPIFIYLIFSEKSSKFGNYRFLLLYFAIFNVFYSILTVLVPLDIHNYRYSFVILTRQGLFMELSDLNFHALAARCSRHATCYIPGKANLELLQYIREDFQEKFGLDSMNFNMAGAMFSVGSDKTTLRAWELIASLSTISIASIISFFVMARLIMQKLKAMTVRTSQKTSRFQFELFRALIVQTVIPICISFSPCTFCWYSAIFGIQLDKSFNYFETIALGVFSFVDPIAIILCLPIFRCKILNAINCFSKTSNKNSTISITKF